MARLTDEELLNAIEQAPIFIDEVRNNKLTEEDVIHYTDFNDFLDIIVALQELILDMAKEIQTLRQQNADMAAWINAQCGGV